MIELWHCHNTRSLRVLWALEELKIAYRLHTLPFPPRVHQGDFLELNPLGTVPFLKDGQTELTESSAMLLYLGQQQADSSIVIPQDHPEYGAYLNWLFSSDATFTFPQTLVLRYSQFEAPDRQQAQVVKDYAIWFLARLKNINNLLLNHQYLVANKFTLADIAVGYALYLGELLGFAEHYQTQTYQYLQRLKARASFQAIKGIGEQESRYHIQAIVNDFLNKE